MLDIDKDGEKFVLPHEKDETFRAAVELSREWKVCTDGFYYEEPDLTPLQRVLRSRIDDLMGSLIDGYKSVLDAKTKLANSQTALNRAREELAAAVAAWPKE